MSGLVAWIDPSQPARCRAAFRRGLSAVADRGRAGRVEVEFDGGWIGAAVDDAGDVGTHGAFTVALDGAPSNLRALTAEQAARESGATTAAEVLAAIFTEIGVEHGLSRAEGSFALVAWDAATRTLWAVRDRAGARPMFSLDGATGFGASSSPGALGDGALDSEGLDRVTRCGFIPPPLSAFLGVERVAAGCLRRRGPTPTLVRWWDAPRGVAGRGGALVRWVQSLEFSARLCVRHAARDGHATWVEDAASLAVLSAAGHPVTGPAPVIVLDVDGSRPPASPAGASEVHRARLGPGDLAGALDDLGALEEPVASVDALGWWAIAREAERNDIPRVLTGRGVEAWLDPQPAPGKGLFDRVRRRARPAPDLPAELDAIARSSPVQPPAAPWLQRRTTLPERALRVADLVGTGAGVRFDAPLCDPRLVQLGASVPVEHHAGIPARLWEAMGAPPSNQQRAEIPLGAWLAGPCAHLLEGLPARLARFVDPTSLGPWPGDFAASAAATERVFALLVLERWLRGR